MNEPINCLRCIELEADRDHAREERDTLLEACKAVDGDHRVLNQTTGELVCTFCVQDSEDSHLPECPMVLVEAAIAKAEGR